MDDANCGVEHRQALGTPQRFLLQLAPDNLMQVV
jgi:hypothetical protein